MSEDDRNEPPEPETPAASETLVFTLETHDDHRVEIEAVPGRHLFLLVATHDGRQVQALLSRREGERLAHALLWTTAP